MPKRRHDAHMTEPYRRSKRIQQTQQRIGTTYTYNTKITILVYFLWQRQYVQSIGNDDDDEAALDSEENFDEGDDEEWGPQDSVGFVYHRRHPLNQRPLAQDDDLGHEESEEEAGASDDDDELQEFISAAHESMSVLLGLDACNCILLYAISVHPFDTDW